MKTTELIEAAKFYAQSLSQYEGGDKYILKFKTPFYHRHMLIYTESLIQGRNFQFIFLS